MTYQRKYANRASGLDSVQKAKTRKQLLAVITNVKGKNKQQLVAKDMVQVTQLNVTSCINQIAMTVLEQNFLEAATRFCKDYYVKDDNNIKGINWEQRRYEIAKDVLSTLVSDPNLADCEIPSAAVYYADALIEELKKKRDMITQMDDKCKSPSPYRDQ